MPPDLTDMNTPLSRHHELLIAKAQRLKQQGLNPEALALVAMVLSDAPCHPEALLLTGIIKTEHEPEGAIPVLESHLALCPVSPEGQFWLGIALLKLKRHEDAVRAFTRLAEQEPDSAIPFRYLGATLEALNRPLDALKALQKAHDLSPGHVDTLTRLGVLHASLGQFEAATCLFREGLALEPDNADLHTFLARALVDLNQEEEAYGHYRRALALRPNETETLVHLATLLIKTSNMDEAEQLLHRALATEPEHVSALSAMGRIRNAQGMCREAVEYFQQAYNLEPDNPKIASNLLMTLNYLPDASPLEIARQHINVASAIYPDNQALRPTPSRHPGPDKPLRIGYLSADFHNHSVSYFFEPILLHHDRSRFLPFLYYGKGSEDDTTRRLKALAHCWRSTVGLDAETIARTLADDCIDILVDLSGHSGLNRLDVCALRSAPLQVSWIGYPHSTGMRQMDYFFSDSLCDPQETADHLYVEKIFRLPRIFCTYLPPIDFPPVSLRSERSDGTITFGCFNNFAKTNDVTLSLWAAILARVPGSRLMLKSAALQSGGSTCRRISDFFAAAGISADRLILQVVKKSQYDHLAQYSEIDVALDTYPYHGTTTTCEAFWMGVPVVTMAGSCHASRVGVSLLTTVGLPDLIAGSPEEYVAMAVALAEDPARRSFLRRQLRSMMALSPLMDAAGVTREAEAAFLAMYRERLSC